MAGRRTTSCFFWILHLKFCLFTDRCLICMEGGVGKVPCHFHGTILRTQRRSSSIPPKAFSVRRSSLKRYVGSHLQVLWWTLARIFSVTSHGRFFVGVLVPTRKCQVSLVEIYQSVNPLKLRNRGDKKYKKTKTFGAGTWNNSAFRCSMASSSSWFPWSWCQRMMDWQPCHYKYVHEIHMNNK